MKQRIQTRIKLIHNRTAIHHYMALAMNPDLKAAIAESRCARPHVTTGIALQLYQQIEQLVAALVVECPDKGARLALIGFNDAYKVLADLLKASGAKEKASLWEKAVECIEFGYRFIRMSSIFKEDNQMKSHVTKLKKQSEAFYAKL